jgi:hypothetical protein
MPILTTALADLDQSVTRPIMTQVINQLKKETQLPENTMIWYPGPDGATYQPTSVIADDSDYVSQEGSQQVNRLGGNNQVTIEVREEFDLDWTLTSASTTPEHLFVFVDSDLGIFMKPTYSHTDVTISVHFRAQSSTQAANWRNAMRQRVSANVDVRLYDLTYSFYVAPRYLTLLQELYRMREAVAGYGDTFDTYLRAHLVSKATQTSDFAGKPGNLRWVIPETQIRVPGFWDFDGFPEEGTRDEKSGTWTATMAFRFKYDRPVGQMMYYPLTVHNQLVDQDFRPNMLSWEKQHANPGYSLTARSLRMFEGNLSNVPTPVTEGYRIPWFDEFIPGTIVPQTKNVIQALLSIDPANPNALFSLNEMSEFALDPDIQTFLISEAPYITQIGQSVFSLMLYQGNDMMAANILSVDSELNVTSTITLDLRQVYHARFALHYDLLGISPAAQQRMQRHCAAAKKIIDALDGRIKLRPGLPMCNANDMMSRPDYMKMNSLINASSRRDGQGNSYLGARVFNTVATLFIDVKSMAVHLQEEANRRLEQRRRLLMCLAARSNAPGPEEASLLEPEFDCDSTGESS